MIIWYELNIINLVIFVKLFKTITTKLFSDLTLLLTQNDVSLPYL